jgi:acetyl-CoA C-acetyltransferase
VAPVTAKTRKGEVLVDKDETPGTLDISKIPTLKPAFTKDGTVTAASSAGISDGAAALVLARESYARAKGCSRWRASWATPASPASRNGSPWRPWAPCRSC